MEAIIIGSITQFGRDDRSTKVGGGAIGGITRRYGLGGIGKRDSKAVVGISARMVDTFHRGDPCDGRTQWASPAGPGPR